MIERISERRKAAFDYVSEEGIVGVIGVSL